MTCAMPAAVQWRGVAEIIANGLHSLPASALITMAIVQGGVILGGEVIPPRDPRA